MPVYLPPKVPSSSSKKVDKKMEEIKERKKRQSKTKMILQMMKKEDEFDCTYDPRFKGWVGPRVRESVPSKWAKARGAYIALIFKNKIEHTIDVDSLVRATKRKQNTNHLRCLMADDSESEKVVNDNIQLMKPFWKHEGENITWTTPRPMIKSNERIRDFSFQKPKPPESQKLSSAVGNHQAQHFKKLLEEKGLEGKRIQNLLLKANDENVKLLEELEKYKGQNYENLIQENKTQKITITRLTRENILLRGKMRKYENRKVDQPHCTGETIFKSSDFRRIQSAQPLL